MDALAAHSPLELEWNVELNGSDDPRRHLRDVVGAFAELPEHVRNAPFTQVIERRMNRALLETILEQPEPDGALDWKARIEARKICLSPYLGQTLVCVFIRLPGVHFTLEIDPELERVVYWEWQST